MEFRENKMGETTVWIYLPSIEEIVKSVQRIGAGASLIVNNNIWEMILVYIYLI